MEALATDDDGDSRCEQRSRPGPLVLLAVCWIVGTIIGQIPAKDVWLSIGSLALAIMLLMAARRRPRGVRVWAHVALVMLGATWFGIDQRTIRHDDIRKWLTGEPQLVRVEGWVEGEPRLRSSQDGAFADFTYQPPQTLFELRLRAALIQGQWRPLRGVLLVKIREADSRISEGKTIRATGWLTAITGPSNPGEFDYRTYMNRRGIHGRLTLARRGNWQELPDTRRQLVIRKWRRWVQQAAIGSLRLGMDQDPKRVAFLDLILLGRRVSDITDLHVSFRRVGLAHLLSISGAHLGILLGLTWVVAKLFVRHPPRAAMLVLLVLTMYLVMIPLRVPIVRAALMAGFFFTGYAAGKRIVGLDLVALAAIAVLIWRPADLFTSGFQLSFGVVAALLQFSRPVSRWLWPKPRLLAVGRTRMIMARWFADYVAVNLVAFLTAMPLVAYHYAIVSPLTVLLSIVALPVVTATLALGYVKMLIGLLLPSAGILLAGPTQWIADCMTGLVENASRWPGIAMELREPATVWWTGTALALMVALVSGAFAKRRKAAAFAIVLCLGWLIASDRSVETVAFTPSRRPALRVNMLSVGDGSCYLLRTARQTVMFDCGSQAFLNMGSRIVLPALRQLGVQRIHTLMLSHPDLDHFCGALDMADQIRIDRVLMPRQFTQDLEDESAVSLLISNLAERGIPMVPVSRGWTEQWGDAVAQVLWPPQTLRDASNNDSSLVLSIRCAGRHVLLTGDIQQYAITELLNTRTSTGGQLRADVSELPHHGSFVRASPRWLKAVNSPVLLQSSSWSRLDPDPWSKLLQDTPTLRLISAQLGMVQLIITRDGSIQWSSFKNVTGHVTGDQLTCRSSELANGSAGLQFR